MPSEIATALAKAQGEMENAIFNKVNPHFGSSYADLAAIRDATVPALSKNNLAIYHVIICTGMSGDGDPVRVAPDQWAPKGSNQWIVRGILEHGPSGEKRQSDFPIPAAASDKPQLMGMAITYGKRYTWAGLCGIATEDDDDGNAVSGNPQPRRAPPPPEAPKEPPPPPEAPKEPPPLKGPPHAIAILFQGDGKTDWTSWGYTLLAAIRHAPSLEEARAWQEQNQKLIEKMSAEAPKVYKRLGDAIATEIKKYGEPT